jgi:hypothetical protein
VGFTEEIEEIAELSTGNEDANPKIQTGLARSG